jgi:phosphoribosylformylglycinamidine (FGAM) synthase-like enzyme
MLADTAWVYSQYDHQLFLNTVEGPGGDAALLRLKHPVTNVDTGRGLALTTDGNHLWCAVDPRRGTALTVAESVLNLACVGARPLALVNCLNFGNPEHPEVMWQLSEAIDGMSEACVAFDLPVVGGNVSLYNESNGRDIDPTPVIGVLGVVDELVRRPPGVGLGDGDTLVLLGAFVPGLGGSRWGADRGARGGDLPALDTSAHLSLCAAVRELVRRALANGLHDVAQGGLAGALAVMVARSGLGIQIDPAAVVDHRELFGEGPSRVVVSLPSDRVDEVRTLAAAHGVPSTILGQAGGSTVRIGALVDTTAVAVVSAYRDHIPDAMRTATTH